MRWTCLGPAVVIAPAVAYAADRPGEAELVGVKRIWSEAPPTVAAAWGFTSRT